MMVLRNSTPGTPVTCQPIPKCLFLFSSGDHSVKTLDFGGSGQRGIKMPASPADPEYTHTAQVRVGKRRGGIGVLNGSGAGGVQSGWVRSGCRSGAGGGVQSFTCIAGMRTRGTPQCVEHPLYTAAAMTARCILVEFLSST